MSCTRRQALLGAAASALGLALPRRARAAGDGLLLVYWVPGGWDPTFVFDPHFESSTIARDPGSAPGTAGGLDFADSATRPSVARFLSRFADRTVVGRYAVTVVRVGTVLHLVDEIANQSRMILSRTKDERLLTLVNLTRELLDPAQFAFWDNDPGIEVPFREGFTILNLTCD